MITIQELELLASILGRAGVTPIEVIWINETLDKLRQMIQAEELRLKTEKALNSPESD